MNGEARGSKVYIITAVVIIITLIMMFVLLSVATNASKKKNEYSNIVPTTKKIDEPVIVTNFNAPLSLIIGDLTFEGNYNYEIRYSGAKFNFTCENFDEESNVCLKGKAIMDAGTSTLNLFDYELEDDNYFKRSDELFITINDDYIILVYDGVAITSGNAYIYKRNGEKIKSIDKVITKYKSGEEIYNSLYPSVTDNKLNFYMCDNKKVKIASINITGEDNLEIIENVDGVICN